MIMQVKMVQTMMALLRTIDNDDDIDEDEDDDDDEKGNSPSIVTSRSQLQFQRSKKLHLIRICSVVLYH